MDALYRLCVAAAGGERLLIGPPPQAGEPTPH
jgi:hypothetical protein